MSHLTRAFACAVLLALVVVPDAARASLPFDQHAVVYGSGAGDPPHQARRSPARSRARAATSAPQGKITSIAPVSRVPRQGAYTNRDCLHHSTRQVLDGLEARFGKVRLVKVCVPGARMPSGHVSWHARNRAFDFHVPKGARHGEVMVWLGKNSPGVTIGYSGRLAGIIHTDTGNFHKVIYRAASHEAGERAVAIWKQRAAVVASGPPLPKPRPADLILCSSMSLNVHQCTLGLDANSPQPFVVASLGDDNALRESIDPSPTQPSPITWGDRRDIFRRYVESRDVVVKPWVTTTCPGGAPLPHGLQALLADAVSHFHCPVYVNSAYRSPAYNRRVGGARNSEHMKCRAVDFRVACVGPSELRKWIVANLNRWGIMGLGTYRSHVHADVRKAQRLVTWNGGAKKRLHRYAKHRKPSRYASAG